MKNFTHSQTKRLFAFCLMFLCFFSSTFAQSNVELILHTNPILHRWDESTFSVNIFNNTSNAATGYSLDMEIIIPTGATLGYQITYDTPYPGGFPYTGIDLAPAETKTFTFKINPNCEAPQSGLFIKYTLNDNTGTPVKVVKTPEVFIGDADILFFQPADFQAEVASTTREYERIWYITPSSPHANLSTVKVTNTISDLANFEIVKAEFVKNMSGAPITRLGGAELTSSEFSYNTGTKTYTYLFKQNNFTEYGFTDSRFRKADTIYIKETFRVKTCVEATSVYLVNTGDGTNWCVDPITKQRPPVVKTSVLALNFTYGSSVETVQGMTDQCDGTGRAVGKYVLNVCNNSGDSRAVMKNFDILLQNNTDKLSILDAYFVNNSNVPIADLPSLTFANDYPGYVGNPLFTRIDFNQLNGLDYSPTNLYDSDGDGRYNDLQGGKCFRILFEIAIDFPLPGSACASTLINEFLTVIPRYLTNCNARTNGSTVYFPVSRLGRGIPQNPLVNPENIQAGTVTTLTFCQSQTVSHNTWMNSVTAYDQFIKITLPGAFTFDPTIHKLRINNTLIPGADITTAEDANGRVVLTVHNKLVAHVDNVAMCFSIEMYLDPDKVVPCMDGADKTFKVEHEFAFKCDPPEDALRYKYGCFTAGLDYLIVDTASWIRMTFDVKRMTFGWTNVNKTQRITTEAMANLLGVDRTMAGPWDNVDFVSRMQLTRDTTYNGKKIDDTFKCSVRTGFDATSKGNCFYFPNPDIAVIVKVMDKNTPIVKGTYYLPESSVQKIITGNHHDYIVDLTPYTFAGDMKIGDWVEVTLKMQTNEDMPIAITRLNRLMTTFHFEPNLDICIDPTVIKNFYVADYAVRDFRVLQTSYQEHNITKATPTDGCNRKPSGVGTYSKLLYPNEYRPCQYATYHEVTFNDLWSINSVSVDERNHRTPSSAATTSTRITLSEGHADLTIDHTGGKTKVVINGIYQSNYVTNSPNDFDELFIWLVNGAPYCAKTTNPTASSKVEYLYYPSSERTDRTGTFALNNFAVYNARHYYNTTMTSVVNPGDIVDEKVTWKFEVWNMNTAQTGNVLDNSWLEVTLPPNVHSSTLELKYNNGTPTTLTNFIYFGSGIGGDKYWVEIGNLTILNNTPLLFTLSCKTMEYVNFNLGIKFGQGKWGYPDDKNPESNKWSSYTICPGKSTITLFAQPIPGMVRGVVISPPKDGVGLPGFDPGYLFCSEHPYKVTFYNTYNTAVLTDPILKLDLCQGLQLINDNPGDVYAEYMGNILDVIVNDPWPAGDSARTVIITFPDSPILEIYGTPGDTLDVYFRLKPVCEFENDFVVYADFSAIAPSGDRINNRMGAEALRVDGLAYESDYQIPPFLLSTDPVNILDLRSQSAANAAQVTIYADIKMMSALQSTDALGNVKDYIGLMIPPNMTIISSTMTYNFVTSPIDFDWWQFDINGMAMYRATMPDMTMGDNINLAITLKPTNIELWDCSDIEFKLFTGIYYEHFCDMDGDGIDEDCGVNIIHPNEQTRTIEILKNPVDFKPGSITAAGVYLSANTEQVTINGVLKVLPNSAFEDLVIEVYSNRTGTLVPIPGVFVTIPNITTNASTTEVSFSMIDMEIPAEEMCFLYLVIRKTADHNLYICDGAQIMVPPPTYTIADRDFELCQSDDLVVGDPAIDGYTYLWAPNTYIKSTPKNTTPVTVNFPAGVFNNYVMNLEIRRGGCTVASSVNFFIHPRTLSSDIRIDDATICKEQKITLTPSVPLEPNPVINWFASPNATTPFFVGPSYTTTHLTADTTFYISVYGDYFCENLVPQRKRVHITVQNFVHPIFNIQPTVYCVGETPFELRGALTSQNGITGTWSPVTISTDVPTAPGKPDRYVFTASSGICIYPATLNITVVPCDLMDCSPTAMPDRIAVEDEYKAKIYTHVGTDWDAITSLTYKADSLHYYINGVLYSHGPAASLDGAIFPLGLSEVTVVVFYKNLSATCSFNVFVECACAPAVLDDEGNLYNVTRLAGLCWTENMKATKYAVNLGGGDIPFAKPYYSTFYPDTVYHFNTFGLLYDWYSAVGETAGNPIVQGICPEGWHIPSNAEWALLNKFPAGNLKSKLFWVENPGKDIYGFDARPAGKYNGIMKRFEDLYGFTAWWSADDPTENPGVASAFTMSYYCGYLLEELMNKGTGLSVRCVEDDCHNGQ